MVFVRNWIWAAGKGAGVWEGDGEPTSTWALAATLCRLYSSAAAAATAVEAESPATRFALARLGSSKVCGGNGCESCSEVMAARRKWAVGERGGRPALARWLDGRGLAVSGRRRRRRGRRPPSRSSRRSGGGGAEPTSGRGVWGGATGSGHGRGRLVRLASLTPQVGEIPGHGVPPALLVAASCWCWWCCCAAAAAPVPRRQARMRVERADVAVK